MGNVFVQLVRSLFVSVSIPARVTSFTSAPDSIQSSLVSSAIVKLAVVASRIVLFA